MAISQGYQGDQFNPAGCIQAYAAASAPSGWLLCDGSAVSRTIYSGLFALIGTTYGAGDGSTTFNIPDMRSRVPVGLSVSDINYFKTLGEHGGEEFHTLTSNEMPSHNHDILFGGSHMSMVPGSGNMELTGWNASGGGLTQVIVQYTGGGAAHNNVQPYLTLNFIIKT